MKDKRILVVDDSKTQLISLQMALEREGFKVITANDGIEGITHAFIDAPDLVISDVIMPELNGYQLCRLLKNSSETSKIPVILLTSMDQSHDRFWGIRAGADQYIVKSSDFSTLKETIKLILTNNTSPAVIKESSAINKSTDLKSIKSNLNHLLDKLLFESTLSNEVGKLAGFIHDREEFLRNISALINSLIDYSYFCLYLCDIDGTRLFMEFKHPASDEVIHEIKDYITQSSNNKVNGYDGEIHFMKNSIGIDSKATDKITGRLFAPLIIGSEYIGNLSLYTTKRSAFSPESENIIRLLAADLSMVLKLMLLYNETRQLSITDGLTKLYNNRYFKEIFEREFERAKRFNKDLSLILLDIDHFKSINDNYGHVQGDSVLKEIGSILKDSTRKIDIVARYGGEEFAILSNDTSLNNTCILAEKIRKNVESYAFRTEKQPLRVTISLGVASLAADAHNIMDLIEMADSSLYQAKEGGRNKVCVFKPAAPKN